MYANRVAMDGVPYPQRCQGETSGGYYEPGSIPANSNGGAAFSMTRDHYEEAQSRNGPFAESQTMRMQQPMQSQMQMQMQHFAGQNDMGMYGCPNNNYQGGQQHVQDKPAFPQNHGNYACQGSFKHGEESASYRGNYVGCAGNSSFQQEEHGDYYNDNTNAAFAQQAWEQQQQQQQPYANHGGMNGMRGPCGQFRGGGGCGHQPQMAGSSCGPQNPGPSTRGRGQGNGGDSGFNAQGDFGDYGCGNQAFGHGSRGNDGGKGRGRGKGADGGFNAQADFSDYGCGNQGFGHASRGNDGGKGGKARASTSFGVAQSSGAGQNWPPYGGQADGSFRGDFDGYNQGYGNGASGSGGYPGSSFGGPCGKGCGGNFRGDPSQCGGIARSSFSELGANLVAIDWSQQTLEQKGMIDGQFLAGAEARSEDEVEQWRMEHRITVQGRDVANPIISFEETGFPVFILQSFQRQGFSAPTVIQSQGWGPAMQGRDMVGIAKTGSGKTLAFGIPGLLHIMAQPPLKQGDGPQMLVIAPTRELSQQIEAELRKVMPKSLRAVCCYGGAPKPQQQWELRKGVNVVIATPGRLIDFLESEVTNLRRVTYLVMDEADRMLDMGFEPDVRKIVSQIRPDRQTLLWSATWPKAVQKLARDFQNDIVQIQVGSDELTANTDITQHIILCSGLSQKLEALMRTLQGLEEEGARKAIIFAGTKRSAEDLCNHLREHKFLCAAIHGDKEQPAREKALWNLKNKPRFLLVATDVAQRGLDVPNLPAVINFDFPDSLEDYIHRIGRTGRAGNKGQAITFFAPAKDCGHAKGLISILQQAGQQVPPGLERCIYMTPPAKPVYGGKKNKDGGGGGWNGGGNKGGWGGGGKGGGGNFGGGNSGGKGRGAFFHGEVQNF